MRYASIALVLLCSAASAAQTPPSLCSTSEQVFFSCRINHSSKVLSLCASKHLTGKAGYLQYRFGRSGKVELEFPRDRKKTQEQFLFAHYFRFQVDRVEVSFTNGNYHYTVYDYYDGTEKPSTHEGVQVGQTDLSCGGPATDKLYKLQHVIACDEDNALNMNGCN